LLPEQVAGHELLWSEDNIKNYPYLLVNPIVDENGNTSYSGPIAYTKPPAIPPAMAALLQITEQDMADLLGNQQNGEEIVSNVSGKAIELIQAKLGMQTFIYMSNMSKAIKRSGEVWLSMAKDLLIESGRKMKAVGQSGELSNVELVKPYMSDEGEVQYQNDLSKAKHDVVVSVGPSSDSKRSATVRSLMGMMQITQDPETLQVLSSMAMMNMDGEGIDDVRDYFRQRLIKIGVIKPNEQESQELQEELANQPPDPNSEYLKSAAEAEKAKAVKAKADTVLSMAKAKEIQARIVEIFAGIDQNEQDAILRTVKELQNAGSAQPHNVMGESTRPT